MVDKKIGIKLLKNKDIRVFIRWFVKVYLNREITSEVAKAEDCDILILKFKQDILEYCPEAWDMFKRDKKGEVKDATRITDRTK